MVVAVAALSAAQEPKSTLNGVYSAAQAQRGEAIYRQNCSACHGGTLMGTEGGPSLTGKDFIDAWKGLKMSDLFQRIKTTMPQSAPGSLADRQYADVLAFIVSKSNFPAGETELPAEPTSLSLIEIKAAN